jgi:IclR family acetate operon transcriptional repressor
MGPGIETKPASRRRRVGETRRRAVSKADGGAASGPALAGQSARSRKGESPRRPQVKTLDKALGILSYLGSVGRDSGVHEVARGVGLHPSTAYRLLSVLARHQFVQPAPEPGRYGLGLRLLELGNRLLDSLEVRAKARPVLEELMAKTRETVFLMILDGSTGIYVERIESPQRVRVAANLGYREYLHCGAVGKSILAHLPADRLSQVLALGLPRLTARTITDPTQLRHHLLDVARRGFAIDDEEGEDGLRCVGAPIFDYQGNVVASVSVSGPAYRLSLDQLNAWGPMVQAAGDTISAALGFRPSSRGRFEEPRAGT